jgi:hypothetical protein
VFIDVLSAMGAIKACIPHCLMSVMKPGRLMAYRAFAVSVCRVLRVLVLVLSGKNKQKKGWKNV